MLTYLKKLFGFLPKPVTIKSYAPAAGTVAEVLHVDEAVDLRDAVEDAVEGGIDLSGADLENAPLKLAHIAGIKANGTRFYNADLYHVVATDGQFAGAELSRVDASHAGFVGADFRNAVAHQMRCERTDFHGAKFQRADFSMIRGNGADFSHIEALRAEFRRARLRNAKFYDADLRATIFRNADLRGADLRKADLRMADLRGADLRGADLRGVDLRECLLHGADLRGAKFGEGTKMSFEADLSETYFDKHHIHGISFYRNREEIVVGAKLADDRKSVIEVPVDRAELRRKLEALGAKSKAVQPVQKPATVAKPEKAKARNEKPGKAAADTTAKTGTATAKPVAEPVAKPTAPAAEATTTPAADDKQPDALPVATA